MRLTRIQPSEAGHRGSDIVIGSLAPPAGLDIACSIESCSFKLLATVLPVEPRDGCAGPAPFGRQNLALPPCKAALSGAVMRVPEVTMTSEELRQLYPAAVALFA